MVPFGSEAGDSNYGYESLVFTNFPYSGEVVQDLMVCTCGKCVAVGKQTYNFAPYHVKDASGLYFYRGTTKAADLDSINDRVHKKYPDFNASSALVLTWNETFDSTYYNLFQFVITSDGENTALVFNYQRLDKKADEVYYMIKNRKTVNFSELATYSFCSREEIYRLKI